MRKIHLLLFLSLFLCGNLFAQTPDKVLKLAAKALGGDKALKAVRSTQMTGRITDLTKGSDGNFQAQITSPNLYYISYDLNGFENASGYNGKSGWVRDSRDGLRTLVGDSGTNFQAESAYHASRWLNYKQDKSKLTPGTPKKINGRDCAAVNLTTAKGVKITLYFDSVTGLPVREEFPLVDGIKTIDYDDFRKVDAVMEPFRQIVSAGEDKFEIKFDSITHNPQIARAVFDFPKSSGDPLPEIQELLKQVQSNQDEVEKLLENYTFTETTSMREIGKDGVMRPTGGETNQITFYQGNRIRRQIEKDGKPLSEKEQEKEDKNVADAIEDLEKKRVKREQKGGPPEGSQRVSIAELLRASNLINPRRERFRGRDVIVFDFEPNTSFDYKNAKSILKFFGKTAGVIWVDEKDRQIVRLEAYLADSFSAAAGLFKLRKGASFAMEQDRINDEIWLPSKMDLNISARVMLFSGMNLNQTTRYGSYKKFKTEVKDAKVDEPKDQ
jgi:hypothetical protein